MQSVYVNFKNLRMTETPEPQTAIAARAGGQSKKLVIFPKAGRGEGELSEKLNRLHKIAQIITML